MSHGLIKRYSKIGLTSRDTHKNSQNTSVTKTYSVDFNHNAVMSCKKMKSKDQANLGHVLYKIIKHSGKENFGAKTQKLDYQTA